MNITRRNNGGKVVASGSFGCVFNPALRCKRSKKRTNGISKLSIKREAQREMKQLQIVKQFISKIPNYKKYFLIDNITTCKPAKLTSSDKKDFDKCWMLEDYDITAENINRYLENMEIINMPYGGITLSNAIETHKTSFNRMNKLLIELLTKAILPMNKLHLYHFDIKADNVLYNKDHIKIIDFGEVGTSTKRDPIPALLLNRPVQFNSPFSRILFSDYVNYGIEVFLSKGKKIKKTTPNLEDIFYKCMLVILKEYEKKISAGHQQYVSQYILPAVISLTTKKEEKKSTTKFINLFRDLVARYCSIVLVKYVDFTKKKFDKEKYFSEVYSKNLDVYGLIMCYTPFIVKSLILLNKKEYPYKIQTAIANIIMKFCFSSEYAAQPIDIALLVKKLNDIK